MSTVVPDALDERIATALGIEYNPHFHKFTSDDEACLWLVEWLVERGLTVQLDGSAITVRHGRKRLFSQAAETPRIALAKAVLRLSSEHPAVLHQAR